MIKVLLTAAMLASFAVGTAYAADTGSTMTPQQRMKECGPKSKGMTKEQRSAFMKQCLSKSGHEAAMAGSGASNGAAATATDTGKRAAQRSKMKTCNTTAKEKALKGTDRKSFMKACLSGH